MVLLSAHPFFVLFRHVMAQLGPTFFDVGNELLESVYHNIRSWPLPAPGRSVELPFLGKELSFASPLPVFYSQPQLPHQLALVEVS